MSRLHWDAETGTWLRCVDYGALDESQLVKEAAKMGVNVYRNDECDGWTAVDSGTPCPCVVGEDGDATLEDVAGYLEHIDHKTGRNEHRRASPKEIRAWKESQKAWKESQKPKIKQLPLFCA